MRGHYIAYTHWYFTLVLGDYQALSIEEVPGTFWLSGMYATCSSTHWDKRTEPMHLKGCRNAEEQLVTLNDIIFSRYVYSFIWPTRESVNSANHRLFERGILYYVYQSAFGHFAPFCSAISFSKNPWNTCTAGTFIISEIIQTSKCLLCS